MSVLSIAACLLALFGGNAARPTPASTSAEFTPIPGVLESTTRLIARPIAFDVLVRSGLSEEDAWAHRAAARRRAYEHTLVRYVPQTDEYILDVGAFEALEPTALEMLASGNFQYVEPDWKVAPSVVLSATQGSASRVGAHRPAAPSLPSNCPDDLFFTSEWHLVSTRLDACAAWHFETGDPGITVALCDTGVRTTHEDLLLHRLEGYNAVDRLWESQGGQITPVYNHGTRTTGVAAANGDNGIGISGIGWDFSWRMIRVSNLSDGGAWLTDLQHAARTAIESGDRIANVSYAGSWLVSNLTTADYIRSLGGILVWAAGNDGATLSYSDRDADALLVVGASDMSDTLASFSNRGTYVDLVAPGVNIETTDSYADSAYTSSASGTSFAAPIASGALALIWSARPELSPADVERILKQSSTDIGAPGIDDQFGYGRVELLAAITRDGRTVPHAEFAAPETSGQSPLAVRFRDTSTGVPTNFLWSFGDGATSTERNPVHTYTSSGSFDVTLSVSNALGTHATTHAGFVLVDIIPPVANFSATPTSGLSPLVVHFTDTSGGGATTQWAWDFGDGATSNAQHPVHTYTSSGTYDVTLTASNAYGSDTLTQYAFVVVDYIAPQPWFSATPTSGNSPVVVTFTNQSTGGVATSWLWTFGDGGASAVANPTHTYTAAGTYTVGLYASNAYGSNQVYRQAYIQVGAGPSIVADFVGTPTSGSAPLTVHFTDLSIGNVTQWEWDFGDNVTSTERNPVHVFTQSGEYDVELQVSNAAGTDSHKTRLQYIVVQ